MIGVSLHFLWSWLFVFHFELGIMGTAYAGIITNGTVLTLNIICAYSIDSVKPAIVAPGAYMWQGIGDYLEIGIPCMLMVLLDGGAWHLMTFTCGFLGVDAQTTQVVIMNLLIILYQVCFGLMQAATALVGQRIGANDVPNARQYYKYFKFYTLSLVALLVILQGIFKWQLAGLFTSNKEVQTSTVAMIWVLQLNTLPDFYKGMLKGLITSLALQKQTVLINFLGQWVLFFSLQMFLAFYLDMGLKGIWIAKFTMESF